MGPLSFILFLQGGYLIGSLSPSYILGKILKNVDIREIGTCNAGTMNTYKVLGLGPAIITALFDLTKGLFVMYVASLCGASPFFVHLVGFAAVLGHVFPFYIHFKGGQGVATATAILIYYLVIFYTKEWLPWESLLLLSICAFSVGYIAKIGEIVGSVVLPILAIFIVVLSPYKEYKLFILSVILYILFINILNIREFKLIPLSSIEVRREFNWRFTMRPLAVLLPVYYLNHSKKEALALIGTIAAFFLLLDLIRLYWKKANLFFFKNIKEFYKSREYRKFSTITFFMVASFLTIFLFEKNIAILAVSYLIFGDFFSKFFGLPFGRTKIFNKSLEGSLAHFNACLLSGFIFLHFLSLPLSIYLTGVLVASLAEVLPLRINDNFSVPLFSASSMFLLQLF